MLLGKNYFSIDDILSTQERIHCQLLVHIQKLAFLESSSSSLRANTKLELPYWLVYEDM
jgi:GINS complex subunit 3